MSLCFVAAAARPRQNGYRRRQTAVCSTSNEASVADYLVTQGSLEEPKYLGTFLDTLESQGHKLVDPSDREGLHPFFIPISENGKQLTGFLRWATPLEGMDVPVVSVKRGELAVSLKATSAELYVKRQLAELNSASSQPKFDVPEELKMEDGAVESLGMGLERYIILKVGQFPDVYEGLARFHELKGDEQSALICAERGGVAFPGWAQGHCFHAMLLQRIKRKKEARDAARYALQLPLWTISSDLREISHLAGYQDATSLEKIYYRLATDPREEEITGGKAPEQVALDRAAYLLDYTVARRGAWTPEVSEELADLYEEGKVHEFAKFLRS